MSSMADAERAASMVRRKRNEHVTAYRCIKCHQFHVGGTDERGEVQRQKSYKRQRARLNEGDE